jgi:hypothetical protein
VRVALVQGAEGEEDHIVDHVRVGNVVHERRKGLDRVGADVVELVNKLGSGLEDRSAGEATQATLVRSPMYRARSLLGTWVHPGINVPRRHSLADGTASYMQVITPCPPGDRPHPCKGQFCAPNLGNERTLSAIVAVLRGSGSLARKLP